MRRVAVIAMGVLVAAVAIVVMRPPSPRSEARATVIASAAEATSDVPLRAVRFGVPVGWTQDADGARRAAVSAVSLTGAIATAGFVTRGDMIDVLASDRFAPSLLRASNAQLVDVLGDLGAAGIAPGDVVFSELPLTATVDAATTDRARVRVWSVVVAGAPGRGSPRQLWRTVTVDLVWEADDWRIDAWSSTPGPTPALATGAPVSSLEDLAAVAGWQPVGGS